MNNVIEAARTIKFPDIISSGDFLAEDNLEQAKIKSLDFLCNIGYRVDSEDMTEISKKINSAQNITDILKIIKNDGFDFNMIISLLTHIYSIGYIKCIDNERKAATLAYTNWLGEFTIESAEHLQ